MIAANSVRRLSMITVHAIKHMNILIMIGGVRVVVRNIGYVVVLLSTATVEIMTNG